MNTIALATDSTLTIQNKAAEAYESQNTSVWPSFCLSLNKRQVYEAVEGITKHCTTHAGSSQWSATAILNLLERITAYGA